MIKKHRQQDDKKVLKLYLPQYVMWLKEYFGITKDFKLTNKKNFRKVMDKCYAGESEEYDDHECWEITRDYEDVSANRRVLVKTRFIVGKMYE